MLLPEQADRRRVGVQGMHRLVDDHPDELAAIMGGSEPADDPEDGLEGLGELGLRRLSDRGQDDRRRDARTHPLFTADEPAEDGARGARRRRGRQRRARGRSVPGKRFPRDSHTRAHGPMVASLDTGAEPPSVLYRAGPSYGAPASLTVRKRPDYTPRASHPLRGPRPSELPTEADTSPWTTVPVPTAANASPAP